MASISSGLANDSSTKNPKHEINILKNQVLEQNENKTIKQILKGLFFIFFLVLRNQF